MHTENFMQNRVTTSLSQFNQKIESFDFFDAIPLGENSAIIISDGMVIKNTNVISISSKIYSTSKVCVSLCIIFPKYLYRLRILLTYLQLFQLLLWRTFFYLSSAFSLFSGLRSRLVLTG